MKKVYIETNGCAVLRHDTYKLSKFFNINGYDEVDDPVIADIVIMTGCAVTNQNEKAALCAIKKLNNMKNKKAKLIVSGCLPSISDEIKNISSDIIEIRNNEGFRWNDLIGADIKYEDVYFNTCPIRHHSHGDPLLNDRTVDITIDNLKIFGEENSKKVYEQLCYSTRGMHLWKDDSIFEIKVSSGCMGKCSYCATRLAIGNFKSVGEKIILEQVLQAKKDGYNKIMLMGDEIGYWEEGEKNIIDLLNDILCIHEDAKIGIRYIHPDILVKYYQDFKKIFSKNKIFYFCSAFQSGSNRILKMMNRNPNLSDYINCIKDIRKNKYEVYIHTQVIVGFPSEKEEDFLKTLDVLLNCNFDFITVTKYSERSGTKAFKYEKLPDNIVNTRYDTIMKFCEINRNDRIYKSIARVLNNYDCKEK